jgi:hypothetical protein
VTPSTSRRRRLLLLSLTPILLAAVAVGVVVVTRARGDEPGPDTPGRPSAAGPLGYAYTTGDELVVHLADGRKIREPGQYQGGALFFTRTGQFVVAAALGSADDMVLTVLDTATGETRRIGCSCASAAPAGGDRIAYVDSATHEAFVLDVFTGARQPLGVRLPQGRTATEVMAGGGDAVLVRGQILDPATQSPSYSSPDVLYEVRLGAPATPRKVAQHAMIVGSSAVGFTGPDGTARFGVQIPDDDGRCNSGHYLMYDGSTGKAVKPPSFVQSAPGETAWMTVTDWWWNDAGILHASLSSYRCTDTFDEEMTAPPTLWKLDAGVWTQIDKTRAEAVRPLGAGTSLLLQQRSAEGRYRLARTSAGAVERLADQVIAVVVAPAAPEPKSTGSPAAVPIDAALLRQEGICRQACRITAQVSFEHPAWGPVTLLTAQARDEQRDAAIAVVDARSKVRWSHWGGAWYELAPAEPLRDSTGNVFLNYNPGRENGVIVLRPTADGLDDLETLPEPGDYRAPFYGAELTDTDGDGTYEIVKSSNDCDPSCADGTVRRDTFRWNGQQYVP